MRRDKTVLAILLAVMSAVWWSALATERAQAASATGPLRVLSSNPRYFTDGSGKAIYLTGSHVWHNLSDGGLSYPPPAFNFTAYLDFLNARHHNFIRLWRWELTRSSHELHRYTQPHPWARTGPGTARDGRPKFDLQRFNQAYFDRLRSRTIAAQERGIYVGIMLFEGWGLLRSAAPWRVEGHPMHRSNNINGINADPNGNGYGTETQIWPLPRGVWAIQQAYIRKVVDTVNDLDNVLYEVSNESTSASTQWQYEVIKYVNSYQQTKPQQHPVGMTMRYGTQTAAGDQVLFDSPATWISPADDPEYDANPPAATGRKVLLPDTDHLCGDCLDRTWVWKSFLRGMNPIFMDLGIQRFPASTDSRRQGARNAMGDTRRYADRMDLAAMTPQNSLSSTGYVLARQGSEYLVYQPGSGSFQVTLAAGTYDYEWFNPSSGTVGASGRITVTDGARSFSPSFSGTAVLYLKRAAS